MVLPSDISPLALLSAERYGGPTRADFTNPTVGLAVARLVPNNPKRLAWAVFNRSVSNIFIWFDNSLTISNGILVAPNGYLQFYWEEDGELPGYEAFAISGTAGQLVSLVEIMRV